MSPKVKVFVSLGLLIIGLTTFSYAGSASLNQYIIQKVITPIKIDGVLDEFAWASAQRVGNFTRILYTYPEIKYHTEAAILWDDTNLYVAFSCVDPEMWTTKTTHDSSLWSEEVVEVFIDPDGDGKDYYELEVNPLNVVVDLKVFYPVQADIPWDTKGLKTMVKAYGAVNNSNDVDQGWTCEIAIPWSAFIGIGGASGKAPQEGDQWRLNLYRIERGAGQNSQLRMNELNDQLSTLEKQAGVTPLKEQLAKTKDPKKLEKLQNEIKGLEENPKFKAKAEKVKEELTKLQKDYEEKTEYTCWSGTYKNGFHDPSRFGVVEFSSKRDLQGR